MASLYMSRIRLLTSSFEISVNASSLVKMPRCCILLICWPAIPTCTSRIFSPDCFSASWTACIIDCTVLSILATSPRITPCEGAFPTPKTCVLPVSSFLVTSTQIFVVPISKPTMIRSFASIPVV